MAGLGGVSRLLHLFLDEIARKRAEKGRMTIYPPGYRVSNRPRNFEPFFSICVPQYNRTDFLIEACQSFSFQDFDDFEICISDDCSNDLKDDALLDYLRTSGMFYVYEKAERNLKYDGNLRNAIALSVGKFLVLMGNDDGMSDAGVLRVVHDEILRFCPVEVTITNYRELPSGRIYRRVTKTGVLGSGVATAVSIFRNYSFVSGIVLKGDLARQESTEVVDGSEMYQMYLGTRIVAAGGRLLGIDRVCVDKDLQIVGQSVDSYRARPRLRPCPIVERRLPMVELLYVVAMGLGSNGAAIDLERNLIRVAKQLYRFTYPFWAIEYRICQSWRFAIGVYLALRPTHIAKRLTFSRYGQFRLWMTYLCFGVLALTIPTSLFTVCKPWLHALAKRVRPA
jgi:glycosyltransferase involved in cell wall biosynthesis